MNKKDYKELEKEFMNHLDLILKPGIKINSDYTLSLFQKHKSKLKQTDTIKDELDK